MKSDTVDLTKVVDALEGLSRELSRLGERVAALEAAAASPFPRPQRSRKRPRQRLPGSPHRHPPLNRLSRRGSAKSSSW